jgi:alpha-D-glucose phosphate-specific phosphoglucomutase
MADIKFGTDGWRAVIANEFTFENVSRLTQAIADVINRRDADKKVSLVIGYDTRFMSRDFAHVIAEVLAANNIFVHMSSGVAATPIVSYMVKHLNLSGGIVVTASHNPSKFNGIKFKDFYGGPAHPDLTQAFEEAIDQTPIQKIGYQKAIEEGLIQESNFNDAYLEFLGTFLDLDKLRSSKWNIALDAMYGAGLTYFEDILGPNYAGKLQTIHADKNPSFGGVNPEPIDKNLKELQSLCQGEFDLGLATDGDGDRIGVIDDRGTFVFSHQLIALFILYLLESRGWSGAIAKSISTTSLIDAIAADKNLEVYETPIGFKYICSLMCEKDILLGGEESGGIGFKNHVPDRDGFLAGLLLIEMMNYYQLPLSKIIENMDSIYGHYYYDRLDVSYAIENMDTILRRIPTLRKDFIEGQKVVKILDKDGIKHIFEDGSWMLIRASGTEPLLRIYAESKSKDLLRRLLQHGKKISLGHSF